MSSSSGSVKIVGRSLTYDDVLLRPKYSKVASRRQCSLKTKLTPKITLNIPIIASNMNTVCEDEMAIAMAKAGGMGILHRYCSVEEQVAMVKRVKRYTNFVIANPYCIPVDSTIQDMTDKMGEYGVGSLLVVEDEMKLAGIVTNRDRIVAKYSDEELTLGDIMTPLDKIVKITVDLEDADAVADSISPNEVLKTMLEARVEQLPIVTGSDKVVGMVCLFDLLARKVNTNWNVDDNFNLVVGAAIGVKDDYLDRASALLDAGCNVLCIDIAHGHSKLAGDTIASLRETYPDCEIIAGNVATADGVRYLSECGADCVKVGVGPGSICITRTQTGNGVTQFNAVMECAAAAQECGVSIIADGGHQGKIGNIFKAIAAGATCSMLGRMVAGTDESPGEVISKDGKRVKMYAGMAGRLTNASKNQRIGGDANSKAIKSMTPEGVEGYVAYKGPVGEVLEQICGGLRSGLSYQGVDSIDGLRDIDIEFMEITNSGLKESKHRIDAM